MKYFWSGAIVGSFLLLPWWATFTFGVIGIFIFRLYPTVLATFFLMDVTYTNFEPKYHFGLLLTILAIIFISAAKTLERRFWYSVE